jgi:hypothetical protein
MSDADDHHVDVLQVYGTGDPADGWSGHDLGLGHARYFVASCWCGWDADASDK